MDEIPIKKNQILPLTIRRLSGDGCGIGYTDQGFVVFVPDAAPDETVEVRIVKVLKSYGYGKIERIVKPGPDRIVPNCACAGQCGGCSFRHLTYRAECEVKTGIVCDAFARLGALDVPIQPILPSPSIEQYRNKVELPVVASSDGNLLSGFYAKRSHRVVPCGDCKLQPGWMNRLAQRACQLLIEAGATAYEECTHTGLVRHLYLRQGWQSGQRLLCFVINGKTLPHESEICRTLAREFSLTTVLIQTNDRRTNVILGRETPRTVLGSGYIEDSLAGVPLRMSVQEFYQVNSDSAETVYAQVRKMAALRPSDFLLDLYCGMGSIGLSMAKDCGRLVGVEVSPQAVESANTAAKRMGFTQQQASFLCMDAKQAAAQLAKRNQHPDVIVLDPPRKGCEDQTLRSVAQMAPRAIVMISCNPATAARDTSRLSALGYQVACVQPIDMFPRTRHVETVILMSRVRD